MTLIDLFVTGFGLLTAASGIAIVIAIRSSWRSGVGRSAGALVLGVSLGCVLAIVAGIVRIESGIPYADQQGVSLSLTLTVTVAFSVGMLIVGALFALAVICSTPLAKD